jgi:LysM repeat protein
VAEIQEKAIEKAGRNLFSRLVHAKDDKDTVASWRLDLNRILHIFNVRPIFSAWLSPTVHLQTELAIDTNANVSDVRRDVTNAHTIVTNTHTLISDIHRNVVRSQGGTDGQKQSVSLTPIHPQQKQNTYYSLDSSQVSDLEYHRVHILTPI